MHGDYDFRLQLITYLTGYSSIDGEETTYGDEKYICSTDFSSLRLAECMPQITEMAKAQIINGETEGRIGSPLRALRGVVRCGDTSKSNTTSSLGARSFDDFRFSLHCLNIIVVAMAMAHQDDIGGLLNGGVVDTAAHSVGVSNDSHAAGRRN
jgi:hypothetical protein